MQYRAGACKAQEAHVYVSAVRDTILRSDGRWTMKRTRTRTRTKKKKKKNGISPKSQLPLSGVLLTTSACPAPFLRHPTVR